MGRKTGIRVRLFPGEPRIRERRSGGKSSTRDSDDRDGGTPNVQKFGDKVIAIGTENPTVTIEKSSTTHRKRLSN